MNYLPIFVDMRHRRVVVVGAGTVALAKLRVLLKTPASIEVVGLQIDPELRQLANQHPIKLQERAAAATDLEGASLVYAATNDEFVNQQVAAWAETLGVWCNVVDQPSQSDFISPALVDRHPIVVAIGTEGTAPILARRIKAHLEAWLSPRLGMMARAAKEFRERVRVIPAGRLRRAFWARFFAKSDLLSIQDARDYLSQGIRQFHSGQSESGFVSFVGAGPGDPELLTLKARKALDVADVVLHDALVSQEILELVRREAIIIHVGKRGFGSTTSQPSINEMLVEYAKQGHQVVRLKGGDPLIFARLDEEIEALNQGQIEFQVIPGVSAANAAAAAMGTSLTARGINSEIRLITGHDAKGYAEHEWRALAKPGQRAAVYMAKRGSRFLQGRLLMHGADATPPVSIVTNVSLPDQQIVETPLGQLSEAVDHLPESAPAILLYGMAAQRKPSPLVVSESEVGYV